MTCEFNKMKSQSCFYLGWKKIAVTLKDWSNFKRLSNFHLLIVISIQWSWNKLGISFCWFLPRDNTHLVHKWSETYFDSWRVFKDSIIFMWDHRWSQPVARFMWCNFEFPNLLKRISSTPFPFLCGGPCLQCSLGWRVPLLETLCPFLSPSYLHSVCGWQPVFSCRPLCDQPCFSSFRSA